MIATDNTWNHPFLYVMSLKM